MNNHSLPRLALHHTHEDKIKHMMLVIRLNRLTDGAEMLLIVTMINGVPQEARRTNYSTLLGANQAGRAGNDGCDSADVDACVLPDALTPLKLADLEDEVDEIDATLTASSRAPLLALWTFPPAPPPPRCELARLLVALLGPA